MCEINFKYGKQFSNRDGLWYSWIYGLTSDIRSLARISGCDTSILNDFHYSRGWIIESVLLTAYAT
jgi:hypothetical protein